MKQKHLENPQSKTYNADEIDLFELFQLLWQEKILIVTTTLVFAAAAFFYNPPGQVQYNTVMTIKPAPLNLYGEFIAGIENGKQQSITLGRYTAEQVLVFVRYYIAENQAEYFRNKNIVSFRIDAENEYDATLYLTTLEAGNAISTLQDYLAVVSDIIGKEVNEFLLNAGVPGTITTDMLFIADDPIITKVDLGENKKEFMIAVSTILGCILGILAAMIRSAIRKRKEV